MTKTDLTGGQSWLKIMWKNGYVAIFILSLLAILFLSYKSTAIIEESGIVWLAVVLLIPAIALICVSYFGFYRFWKYLKNGKSR